MLTKKCEVCGAKISRKAKICPYCYEKPNKISAAAIKTFFLWFVLIIAIGMVLFNSESTESNKVVFSPPTWYIPACYIIPAIATVSKINNIKKGKSKKNKESMLKKMVQPALNGIKSSYQKKFNLNDEFCVPRSKKSQEKVAAQLLDDARANVELANKSDKIGVFVLFYDDALECFRKLSLLDKVKFRGDPGLDFTRLQSETQWHLCDALNRQKEKVISEIRGKYKNSREFQEKLYEYFKSDIENLRSRFSEKTSEFADECLHEVEKILGICSNRRSKSISVTCGGIAGIDFMDGHQFEYWCADLLRKIGFVNVEVTQGSGDQGVDIIAKKDGIKYAIQCKCYSSDLGNKPVQEVNTGKAIYHCQIGAVITNRHFTQGGQEAAEATGVLLWDRDWIQSKLEEIKE